MRGRFTKSDYVVFGLVAIGVLFTLLSSPGHWIIPIAVFGIIFLFYKYPPNKIKRGYRPKSKAQKNRKQSKKASFRVIRGSKSNDDEPPKYH